MGVTSAENNNEKVHEDGTFGEDIETSLLNMYEPGGSSFIMSKLTNGFSVNDVSNSPVGFQQCQVVPNFSKTSADISLEYGRSRGSRKEKKRTECINNAFSELRRRIPNVPMDTKLSKIKTLRLATSYIAYLTDIVQNEDPSDGRDGRDFRADLKSLRTRERRRQLQQGQMNCVQYKKNGDLSPGQMHVDSATAMEPKLKKKNKGRTGWPEAVWAMELENISSKGGLQVPLQVNQTVYPISQGMNGSIDRSYTFPYSTKEDGKRYMENLVCDGHTDNGQGRPYNFGLEAPMMTNPSFHVVGGSYARQEEVMPYFTYPSLSLPSASSFSKKLPPIPSLVPEMGQMKHGLSSVQSFINSGVSTHDESVGTRHANAHSTFSTIAGIPETGNDQIARNNGVGQPTLGNFPLISDIREEKRNGDAPKYIFENDTGFTAPSFVELKTVSAASIRISTSTINGYATFTTTGRPEVQCFGATSVAEPCAL